MPSHFSPRSCLRLTKLAVSNSPFTIHHLQFTFLFAAALILIFAPLSHQQHPPTERTIQVEASRFAYQPGVIRVNPGDRVTLELLATDVVHGLSLDGYDVEMSSDPGQVSRVTFTADQRGVFRFRCTQTCGDMHPFMIGKLQVGSNTLLWRAVALTLVASAVGVWRWKK